MKINNLLKFIVIVLLSSFMFLIIISQSGYYEYELKSNKELTEEQIKRFEKDIKRGINIDTTKYIKEKKDNSNKISRLGNRFSSLVNNIASKTFKKLFKYIEKQI